MKNKKLHKLIKLMKLNPNLKVMFMADSNIIEREGDFYWSCKIKSAEVNHIYCTDDSVYVGIYEISDYLRERLPISGHDDRFCDYRSYIDNTIKEMIENKKIKAVILVYLKKTKT